MDQETFELLRRMAARADAISGRVDGIADDLAGLRREVTGLGHEVSDLRHGVGVVVDAVTGLGREVAALRKQGQESTELVVSCLGETQQMLRQMLSTKEENARINARLDHISAYLVQQGYRPPG